MANTLKLEIIVDDKGTPVVQKFADGTTAALGKVETAGSQMGGGFEKSWAGIATGANQAIQLFQQVAAAVEAPIMAYMEAEKAELKLGMAMKNQGDFTREGLLEFQEYAAQIQKTTAYEDDLMMSVMGNMKSYGMSSEEVKKATQAAMDLAAAKASEGMTIEKASEIMGKSYLGISTGLKKLGIQVDENSKGAQLFDSVMGQVNARFGGSAQAELLTYVGQWKQLRNQWGDIQEFLGLTFLKTIEAIGFGIGMVGAGFWTTAEMILSGWGQIVGAMADVSKFVGLSTIGNGLEAIAGGLKDGATNAKEASAAAIKNASANYDNMVSFDKVSGAIDKMGIAGKRTQIIDEEAAKAREKAAKEAQKNWLDGAELIAKLQEETNKQYEEDLKFFTKMEADKVKALEKEMEGWRKAGEAAEDAMMADIAMGVKMSKDTLDRLEKKRTAEREIYKDLRGYEGQFYEESKVLIDEQAQKYREYGVSKIAVDAWVAEEYQKAELKKLSASKDWSDGVKAQLIELERRHTTWGSTAYEITKRFTGDAERELSTNFFNIMKGNFNQIGIDWGKLYDGMLTTLSQQLSKMVMEAAAKQIIISFGAVWTEVAKPILGTIARIAGGALETWWNSSGNGIGASDDKGSYSQGGHVPGYASGGDSPANDTVPAWLSPGEVVIRRTSVNPATEAILDYINRYGQPPQYAFGGRVMNQVTDTPGRGYWGLSDIVSVVSGGASDIAGITKSDTGGPSIGDIAASFHSAGAWDLFRAIDAGGSAYDIVDRAFDPGGTVDPSLRAFGASLPQWLRDVAPMIGGMIGQLWGQWMAAAGAGAGSKIAGYDTEQSMRNASMAALMKWASGTSSPGLDGLNSGLAKSAAINYAKKWAIGQVLGSLFPAENGGLNFTYEGMSGGPDLSGLAAIAPQSSSFAFSARNGLDYVPYDNFKANLHQGERVQTRDEARAFRDGSNITIEIPIVIEMDGRAIARSSAKQVISGGELTEAIDRRIKVMVN